MQHKCPLTGGSYDKIMNYDLAMKKNLINKYQRYQMKKYNRGKWFEDFNESFCVKVVKGKLIRINFE